MGRKGRRFLSSGGTQAFQFEHEERGPSKLILSIASGTWAVLVQSQRRQRFLMTMMDRTPDWRENLDEDLDG